MLHNSITSGNLEVRRKNVFAINWFLCTAWMAVYAEAHPGDKADEDLCKKSQALVVDSL